MNGPQSLGTQLRHLVDLLDSAVQQGYDNIGLDYRPRFTPLVRAIQAAGPAPIRSIALRTGLTHSAVSQTVSQMAKMGLVEAVAGEDGRERIVTAKPRLLEMLPALERQWTATNAAAATLDAQLPYPLSELLAQATAALQATSFADRIAAQNASLGEEQC